MIAAKIGQFIGLPIPAYAVTYSTDGTTFWFSSIYFNFDKDELPPVQPDVMWREMPGPLSGVMMFDVLIANADRHDKNLAVDDVMNPRHLRVIDHDQALFGGMTGKPRGIERLTACRDLLGLSEATGGQTNDFIAEFTESRHFGKWINRISEIPEWFIKDSVNEAKPYGVSSEEAKACIDFLVHRKVNLKRLIMDNRIFFTNIQEMKLPGMLL
jgi:hypothetical protein